MLDERPDVLAAVTENDTFVRQLIAGWLDAAVALGEIDPEADTARLAMIAAGIMRGVYMELMIREEADHEAAAATAVDFVESSLRTAISS